LAATPFPFGPRHASQSSSANAVRLENATTAARNKAVFINWIKFESSVTLDVNFQNSFRYTSMETRDETKKKKGAGFPSAFFK
jgi:hypothetical protein